MHLARLDEGIPQGCTESNLLRSLAPLAHDVSSQDTPSSYVCRRIVLQIECHGTSSLIALTLRTLFSLLETVAWQNGCRLTSKRCVLGAVTPLGDFRATKAR